MNMKLTENYTLAEHLKTNIMQHTYTQKHNYGNVTQIRMRSAKMCTRIKLYENYVNFVKN